MQHNPFPNILVRKSWVGDVVPNLTTFHIGYPWRVPRQPPSGRSRLLRGETKLR